MKFRNPIIERYRCSLMRPTQMWIQGTVYALVIGVMLLINVSIYRNQPVVYHDLGELCASLYVQFAILMVAMLWFWGAYNSGSAIRDEVVEKSYDFFRLLPLSPREKATGILVGKNLVMLVLAPVTAVLMILAATFGRVGFRLQAQVFLFLLSVALLAHFLSLLTSQLVRVRRKSGGSAGALLLGLFLFPYVIALFVGSYKEGHIQDSLAGFYGMRVPALLLVSAIVLYFVAWAQTGVLRLFRYDGVTLFTRGGAIGFAVGFQAVMLGLFWPHFLDDNGKVVREVFGYFLIASFFPLLCLPFGSVRTFENLLEMAGTERQAIDLRWVLRRSNLSLWMAIYLVWAAGVALAAVVFWMDSPGQVFASIGVLFSFYLFLCLIVELGVVNLARYPKLGILLGAIILLQAILPLVMAGILEVEEMGVYSPFGFWGMFFASRKFCKIAPLMRVFVVNLLLGLIPAYLVLRRYLEIPADRARMQPSGSE